MRHRSIDSQIFWLSFSLAVCILVFSVLPIVRLFIETVRFSTADSPIASILSSPRTWRALSNSFYTSTLGSFIAMALGCAFAFSMTLTNVRAKPFWIFLFMIPMMIPPQVTALSWLQLFGPASPLLNSLGIAPALGSPNPMYSAEGIALLLGIQNAPLVFLIVRSQLLTIPKDLIEAATIASASGKDVLFGIILPLSRSSIASGTALAFVSSLGNFGIPAMLGIPINYLVLPTLIYQRMAGFGQSVLGEVAALSMMISVLVLVGMVIQQTIQQNSKYSLIGHSSQTFFITLGKWRKYVELLTGATIVFVLVIPLIALIMTSLVPALGMPLNASTISLNAYDEMLNRQGSTLRAFENSIFLATTAAIALMIFSFPASYIIAKASSSIRTAIVSIVEVPYAIPGVVLSIAFILLFVKPIPIINVNIYSTLTLILLAYISCYMAVAMKPVATAVAQMDKSLEEAAQISGARTLNRIVDIVLPLTGPAVFAGGLMVFLISVNELTVSALLWSAGNETIGVLIFGLDQSGYSVLASAISVLVVIMVIAVMLALSLLSNRLPKGVIPWQDFR